MAKEIDAQVHALLRPSAGTGPNRFHLDPDHGRRAGRNPSNTSRDLRNARGSGDFAWVTSHVFRKTAATELDRAGPSARQIADQLGHARPSITQDSYLGRRVATNAAADALDRAYREASTDDPDAISGA